MRIDRWLKRGWLIDAATDYEKTFSRARALSQKYTEKLGCRGFDLLHVACALELDCETFFTADHTQASLARAERFTVIIP